MGRVPRDCCVRDLGRSLRLQESVNMGFLTDIVEDVADAVEVVIDRADRLVDKVLEYPDE